MMIILIASMKAVPIGCNDAANDGQTKARISPMTSPANICNGSPRLIRVAPAFTSFMIGTRSLIGVHTVATALAGEPTAPGRRRGGAVSRKRERPLARSQSASSESSQISPR